MGFPSTLFSLLLPPLLPPRTTSPSLASVFASHQINTKAKGKQRLKDQKKREQLRTEDAKVCCTANNRHLLRRRAKIGERPSFRPHNSYSKMNIAYVSVLGENTTHYFVVPYFSYLYRLQTSVICFIIYCSGEKDTLPAMLQSICRPGLGLALRKLVHLENLFTSPFVLLESFNLLRDYYDTL